LPANANSIGIVFHGSDQSGRDQGNALASLSRNWAEGLAIRKSALPSLATKNLAILRGGLFAFLGLVGASSA
jgi:hypothetical protein